MLRLLTGLQSCQNFLLGRGWSSMAPAKQLRLLVVAGSSDSSLEAAIEKLTTRGWQLIPTTGGNVSLKDVQALAMALKQGHDVVVKQHGSLQLDRRPLVLVAAIFRATLIGLQLASEAEKTHEAPPVTDTGGFLPDYLPLEDGELEKLPPSNSRFEALSHSEGFARIVSPADEKALETILKELGEGTTSSMKTSRSKWDIDANGQKVVPPRPQETQAAANGSLQKAANVSGIAQSIKAQEVASQLCTSHAVSSHLEASQPRSSGVGPSRPWLLNGSAGTEVEAAPNGHLSGQKRKAGKAFVASPSARSSPGQIKRPATPYDEIPSQNGAVDLRPIILFDLNGTITSHTAQRYSSGTSKPRPGIRHLRRLKPHFRLGIYSSATDVTVMDVIPMLEKAAGAGPRLFEDQHLILHRGHTMAVSKQDVEAGAKVWDTFKPISNYFSRMDRVILVDDDAFKVRRNELDNLILVESWDHSQTDTLLSTLVDTILLTLQEKDEKTDMRSYTHEISSTVRRQHIDAPNER